MSPETENPGTGAEAPKGVLRRKLTKVGTVTSNKMTKTVVVTVKMTKAHKTYGRTVRSSKSFMAHEEKAQCRIGDRVQIMECRPLSRLKRWRVVSVIEKSAIE